MTKSLQYTPNNTLVSVKYRWFLTGGLLVIAQSYGSER